MKEYLDELLYYGVILLFIGSFVMVLSPAIGTVVCVVGIILLTLCVLNLEDDETEDEQI